MDSDKWGSRKLLIVRALGSVIFLMLPSRLGRGMQLGLGAIAILLVLDYLFFTWAGSQCNAWHIKTGKEFWRSVIFFMVLFIMMAILTMA